MVNGDILIKIIVEKCELIEGDCDVLFKKPMFMWLEGKHDDQMILNYAKSRAFM
jgi:hypothetical protein